MYSAIRLIVIVALLLASVAFGQTTLRITGQVTDSLHGPIANTKVVLKVAGSKDTVEATTTDQNGRFKFSAVSPGLYDLHFQSPGFALKEMRIATVKDVELASIVMEVAPIEGPAEPLYYVAPIAKTLDESTTLHSREEIVDQAAQAFIPPIQSEVPKLLNKPSEPIKTTLCEIVKAPEQFNGKTVQVRAEYVSKFQWTGLKDGSCSASIPFGVHHPVDDLKPEQGEYAFTTVADDNDHPERLHWKPIERLLVVDLKEDGDYRKLRKYAASKFRWSDGGVCRDCPFYRIALTAIGRFDYFPTQTVSVRINPATNSAGEPDVPLLRLVLNSVSNIATTPIDPSVYTEKKGRSVTVEEAHELVTTFIRDRGSSGFSLDQYENKYYQGFQFFQVMGDDPGGSIHYAVDLKTGEVWSGVICENMTSHSLKKLQKAIRKRIGLTEDEYQDAPKNGPMCEPGMPRASKTK